MNAAEWYRRHLGGGGPTSTGFPPSRQAPAAPTIPAAYAPPPGYRLVPVEHSHQMPPQGYDQTDAYLAQLGVGMGPVNQWTEAPPSPVDTSRIPRGAVNAENFMQLANLWRGSRGRQEALHCPRCDGVMFRRFEHGIEARPLCTACGYNGQYDQGEYTHGAA